MKQEEAEDKQANKAIFKSKKEEAEKTISGYSKGVREKAKNIVHIEMPQKITHIDSLIQTQVPILRKALREKTLADKERVSVCVATFQNIKNKTHKTSSEPQVKRRRVELPAETVSITDKKIKEEKGRKRKSSEDVPSFQSATFDSNSVIMDLMKILKTESSECVEMLNRVKIWIYLKFPKMEGGNNFGVEVQETVVSAASTAEVNIIDTLDNIWKYFDLRAQLVW
eukprot:CAMPEP_0174270652 /NCGR_PEP_ID=MMETSP0439-20130205/45213_1 /TAXON_ID=0 /ORGANISM="Stereomyxa ramosa, Strain Chinc5" /LENGTH=225 /DNA_ID=CAMNT_0015360113 /DNA_START=64 /DNA_END=738 /DNA_ORIENTATION=-